MKTIFLLGIITCLLSNHTAGAQEKTNFILKQFTNAKVYFKNRSITIAPMNYDVANNRMFYKTDTDVMELTGQAQIDSIVWEGKYKFVVSNNSYLHELSLPNGKVFIQWRVRDVNVGKQGALGLNTQAKVEQIDLRSIGIYSYDTEFTTIDIYKASNRNEYFIPLSNQLKKVTNVKSLIKLFPQQRDQIVTYAQAEKIDMNNVSDALKIINYVLGL